MAQNVKIDHAKLALFTIPLLFIVWASIFQLSNLDVYISLIIAAIATSIITIYAIRRTHIYHITDDGINVKISGLNRNISTIETTYSLFLVLLLFASIAVMKLYSLKLGVFLASILFICQFAEFIRKNKNKYPVAQVVIISFVLTTLLLGLLYLISMHK